MLLIDFLAFVGRYGRWVLPIGLLVGLLPWATQLLQPAIAWLITLLLFLATLRILTSARHLPGIGGEHEKRQDEQSRE